MLIYSSSISQQTRLGFNRYERREGEKNNNTRSIFLQLKESPCTSSTSLPSPGPGHLRPVRPSEHPTAPTLPLPPFLSLSRGFRLVVNVSDTRGPGGIYHGRDIHTLNTAGDILIAALKSVPGAAFYLSTRNITSGARAVMSEFSAGPNHLYSVQVPVVAEAITFAESAQGHAWVRKEGFPEFRPEASLAARTEKVLFGNGMKAEVDLLRPDTGRKGCVSVRVFAECAVLPEVPEGSVAWAYRQGAEDVKCHKSLP